MSGKQEAEAEAEREAHAEWVDAQAELDEEIHEMRENQAAAAAAPPPPRYAKGMRVVHLPFGVKGNLYSLHKRNTRYYEMYTACELEEMAARGEEIRLLTVPAKAFLMPGKTLDLSKTQGGLFNVEELVWKKHIFVGDRLQDFPMPMSACVDQLADGTCVHVIFEVTGRGAVQQRTIGYVAS